MEPRILLAPVGDNPPKAELYYGQDVLETLKHLPDRSVHTIITSPPYFNLRAYLPEGHHDKDLEIGIEESPEEYTEKLVAVFREAKRVLHDMGILWVNLADSYVGGGGYSPTAPSNLAGSKQATQGGAKSGGVKPQGVLKSKDLCGIPWRVAFALQADGWYLRSDCVWDRKNCMPESVSDRCTRSHEYIFMLTKKPRYFFDMDSIREPFAEFSKDALSKVEGVFGFGERPEGNSFSKQERYESGEGTPATRGERALLLNPLGRNRRTVWTINSAPFKGAHFATFAEALPEIMIKAGSSQRGCCPHCFAPWKRLSGKPCEKCGVFVPANSSACPTCGHVRDWKKGRVAQKELLTSESFEGSGKHVPRFPGNFKNNTISKDWIPTCSCPAHEPIRCTVLDPFSGSGTTGQVAFRLGRNYIGCDLNKEYEALAVKRITGISAQPEGALAVKEGSILDLFGSK